MPTTNPRVNITFEHATVAILSSLAKQEHKSLSGVAKELVLEALERREDKVLSALAETREKNAKTTIKHDDAWK